MPHFATFSKVLYKPLVHSFARFFFSSHAVARYYEQMISYNQSYICRRRPFEYDSTRFRHSSLKKFSASEIAPSTGEIADALIEMEQRIKRQQTALRPGMV